MQQMKAASRKILLAAIGVAVLACTVDVARSLAAGETPQAGGGVAVRNADQPPTKKPKLKKKAARVVVKEKERRPAAPFTDEAYRKVRKQLDAMEKDPSYRKYKSQEDDHQGILLEIIDFQREAYKRAGYDFDETIIESANYLRKELEDPASGGKNGPIRFKIASDVIANIGGLGRYSERHGIGYRDAFRPEVLPSVEYILARIAANN